MATEKDEQIFVCGITQYTMNSGQFGLEQLPLIGRAAQALFRELFGAPGPDAAPAPSRAPGASQRPPVASEAPIPSVETKPFSLWGGDKAHYGRSEDAFEGQPIREIPWATWVGWAMEGNVQARKILEIMANSTPGDDPQWRRKNMVKISRARACLAMVKAGPQQGYTAEPPETF